GAAPRRPAPRCAVPAGRAPSADGRPDDVVRGGTDAGRPAGSPERVARGVPPVVGRRVGRAGTCVTGPFVPPTGTAPSSEDGRDAPAPCGEKLGGGEPCWRPDRSVMRAPPTSRPRR